jgi:hypothetical protein
LNHRDVADPVNDGMSEKRLGQVFWQLRLSENECSEKTDPIKGIEAENATDPKSLQGWLSLKRIRNDKSAAEKEERNTELTKLKNRRVELGEGRPDRRPSVFENNGKRRESLMQSRKTKRGVFFES